MPNLTPEKAHLIIPGAVAAHDRDGPSAALAPLTPNLRALLAAMAPAERIECADDSPATPFELALARANGLPGAPGYIAFAAFEAGIRLRARRLHQGRPGYMPDSAVEADTAGLPCAFVHLCHWQMGSDHVLLSPPEDLAIDDEVSHALLCAMAPYFLEDGMTLQACESLPGTWLATGEPFRHLRCISIDRLRGRRLTRSMLESAGASAATLRRLQNEMQMLLYTHLANDVRQRQGLLPVNSFWIAGAGALEQAVQPMPGLRVESRLSAPAVRRDAAAHARAWHEVDADSCAILLATLRAGGDVRLTLCGDNATQAFIPAKAGFWPTVKSYLGLKPIWDGRNQL